MSYSLSQSQVDDFMWPSQDSVVSEVITALAITQAV